MNNLRRWIAMATAADTVETDRKIAGVMPFFEEVKSRDSQDTLSERKYEGMRQLMSHVLDRESRYVAEEIDFVCYGLWHKGYFPKEEIVIVEDEGGEISRKVINDSEFGGMTTRFMYPAKHLLRRNRAYKEVLISAFERLLERSEIPQETTLASRRDDLDFGAKLYDEVPESTRKAVFRRLSTKKVTDNPLAELRDKEGKIRDGSTQVSWVLPYFVGVNREFFLKKIREHYKKR